MWSLTQLLPIKSVLKVHVLLQKQINVIAVLKLNQINPFSKSTHSTEVM